MDIIQHIRTGNRTMRTLCGALYTNYDVSRSKAPRAIRETWPSLCKACAATFSPSVDLCSQTKTTRGRK